MVHRSTMLQCIGATLKEVVEVSGSPLHESELWAVLRSVAKVLIQTNVTAKFSDPSHFILSPQKVILLPFGQVAFNFEITDDEFTTNQLLSYSDGNVYDSSLQVHSLGLTMLWCAEYNLPPNNPLTISNDLQEVLLSMCTPSDYTLEQVHAVCCNRDDVNFSNDLLVVSKLCSSILGNMPELNSLAASNMFNMETSPKPNKHRFQHSFSISSSNQTKASIGQESCLLGKKYIIPSPPQNDPRLPSNPVSVDNSESSSLMAEYNDENSVASQPINPRLFLNAVKPRHGILKTNTPIKRLHQNKGNTSAFTAEVIISFVDRTKIAFPISEVSGVRVESVIQLLLKHLMPDANPDYFALATFQDSEYRFLETNIVLSKAVTEAELKETLFLRILYFPLDLNTVNGAIIRATYMQLRDDVISERVVCTHDDALSIAALALQCEIGDYKTDYGLNYFVVDDFVPNRVTSQLGISYIRSELPALHRQLAGIGEPEARSLFLRRCQQFDEYGMHFYKAYRLKSCKDTSLTWMGAGPHGITIFDIKGNDVRIKRHVLKWDEMKNMHYKSHKIILTKLSPHVRFKFYQQHNSRAKYIVHLVGKLHQFYGSMQTSNQFSSLALFDDITRLSSNLNLSSLSRATEDSSSEMETTESSLRDSRQWTYKNPKNFVRNDHVIRRRSSASLSSPSGEFFASNPVPPERRVSRANTAASRFSFQKQIDSPMLRHAAEHIIKATPVDTSTPNKGAIVSTGRGQFSVQIRKVRGSFGFTIAGGSRSQSSITMNDDVIIRELVEGGPAISMGTVAVGDRLIAINNVSLQGVTHEEAVTALRNAPSMSTLLIERYSQLNSHQLENNKNCIEDISREEHEVLDSAVHATAVNFYRKSLSYDLKRNSVRGAADGLSDLSHHEYEVVDVHKNPDALSPDVTQAPQGKSDSVNSYYTDSTESF
nr:tyrosine-protein phosphatase non-receptor type 13-like isoform X1 [Ciona intestinalis]XP_018667116.1 tyrosine-protein phosphatase non-receptor type 13-like isoform X1 [Ciona intestinalis]|eukprot:XP_009858462.2 tyrosine-protein phosphatase non-receptor type 13-like isoform X1 [Ciona intestinalis]